MNATAYSCLTFIFSVATAGNSHIHNEIKLNNYFFEDLQKILTSLS